MVQSNFVPLDFIVALGLYVTFTGAGLSVLSAEGVAFADSDQLQRIKVKLENFQIVFSLLQYVLSSLSSAQTCRETVTDDDSEDDDDDDNDDAYNV